MKGLDLAEAYYRELGAPMLASRFGRYVERIAVGLAGPGSECLGFDDEVSRDHDWGPGFCLWLTDEDFDAIGGELQWAYTHLAETFLGYGPRTASDGEEWRVGTVRTGGFYARLIGFPGRPATTAQWQRIPEHALAACTSGRVFHDPFGDFSRRREDLLAHYPDDVRLLRIASLCVTAGQAGQYNFARSSRRGEHYAAAHSAMLFATDAMRLTYQLNRRYAPFAKWLHRGVATLPILGPAVQRHVSRMIEPGPWERTLVEIEQTVALLVAELRLQRLSDAPGEFMFDHAASIRERIVDPALRERRAVAT